MAYICNVQVLNSFKMMALRSLEPVHVSEENILDNQQRYHSVLWDELKQSTRQHLDRSGGVPAVCNTQAGSVRLTHLELLDKACNTVCGMHLYACKVAVMSAMYGR